MGRVAWLIAGLLCAGMACSGGGGAPKASTAHDAGKHAAPRDAASASDAAIKADASDAATKAADGPVALPDGDPGIQFDDLQFAAKLRKVIVPAGRSGRVDLIDPDTSAVTSISGLSASDSYSSGTRTGSTSAVEAGDYLAALDQTTGTLAILDPKAMTIAGSVALGGTADYVRYVAPAKELWVTNPIGAVIDVYALPSDTPPTPSKTTSIDVTGGPESFALDSGRNRVYTDAFTGTTHAIDLKTHAIAESWTNGCNFSLGLSFDEARGFLFVACGEGKVITLDAANGGAKLSELETGSGLDLLSYNPELEHLYAASGADAALSIMGVSAKGELSMLGTVPTAQGARCVVADDRSHAWVCDPDHGQVLRITDAFPKGP